MSPNHYHSKDKVIQLSCGVLLVGFTIAAMFLLKEKSQSRSWRRLANLPNYQHNFYIHECEHF